MCRWSVTNVDVQQREKKTKCRSRIRSTKQGFVKKNVGGFRYKPRGDWFSFAKVRKLCFLCSCKQMLLFARLTRTCVSGGIHRKGCISWMRIWQLAEVTQNCLYHLKYGLFFIYFFVQKWTNHYRRPLFTHRSHVRHVLRWMDALYLTTFGLLNKNTCPLPL